VCTIDIATAGRALVTRCSNQSNPIPTTPTTPDRYVISTTPFPFKSAPTGSYSHKSQAMPNHLQLLFLLSFFSTFVLLFILSNHLSSKLREAGYDISKLILIGLPQSDLSGHHIPNQLSTSASFLGMPQSVIPQLLALVLAVATSAFVYLKFVRSGMSSFPTQVTTSSHTLFREETCSGSKRMEAVSSQRENYNISKYRRVRVLPYFTSTVLTSNIDIASLFHVQLMFLVSLLASIYRSPQK
jgi:hypothetical protein